VAASEEGGKRYRKCNLVLVERGCFQNGQPERSELMSKLLFSMAAAAAIGLVAYAPSPASASWLSEAYHRWTDRNNPPAPAYDYPGYGYPAPGDNGGSYPGYAYGDRQGYPPPGGYDQPPYPRRNREDGRQVWTYGVDGGGRFEHMRGDRWVQVRDVSGPPLYYRETNRTSDYVELYDQSRDLYVRLYDDVLYQNPNGQGWGVGFQGNWR
jgi:hypothetical protein